MSNRYRVVVSGLACDDRRFLVGEVIVAAESSAEARRLAIDELWDPRLSAASCSPDTHVYFIDDGIEEEEEEVEDEE